MGGGGVWVRATAILSHLGALSRRRRPRAARRSPQWGQILATTVKLSVLRRVALGFGAARAADGSAGTGSACAPGISGGWPPGAGACLPSCWPWRSSRRCCSGSPAFSPATHPQSPGRPPRAVHQYGKNGTSSPSAAARSQAAAWIAAQVSGNAIIACYPDMCAALQAQGVLAGPLMPLKDGAASPL